MKRLKVFVTGPLETAPEQVALKRLETISLISRRILLTRHIPVCPYLQVIQWMKDPRLPKDTEWWVGHYFMPFIRECDLFCSLPDLAGNFSHSLESQKAIWRSLEKHPPVTTDTVVDTILNITAKEILT